MMTDEQLQELRESIDLWTTLQEHSMWQTFQTFLHEQIGVRRGMSEYGEVSMEQIPHHFRLIGEINGLGIAAEYPGRMLADLRQELKDQLKLREARNG